MTACTAIALLFLCCSPAFAADGHNGSAADGSAAGEPVAATITSALSGLPVLPQVALRSLYLPLATYRTATRRKTPGSDTRTLPDAPSSLTAFLESVPVAGRIHRRAGPRFNTSDGSSVDAFAICYRMTHRLGMQVIPGDPAPVKLAVSSMANNTGVTVGMTLRLSH